MKNDLYILNLDNLTLGNDFKIASKIVMTDNCDFTLYKEGESDEGKVVDTFFVTELVEQVYHIDNHKVDFDLAVTLGLGVIEDLDTGEQFLYNIDVNDGDNRGQDEALRIGMYYQITHPEHDDKKLDTILCNTAGGEQYLRLLFLIPNEEPIKRLKEIFNSKRGNQNNVVKFKK